MRGFGKLAGTGIAPKVAVSLALVGVAGAAAGLGTLSAFSGTTSNAGNTFASGTVAIGDNDAGAAMYSVSGARPGDSVSRCIKLTYTGSLDADVKLYTPEPVGPGGQYVDLTFTPGTQATSTFPSCTGFTPAAGGAVYTGTLGAWAAARNSHANGLATTPAGAAKWSQNAAVVYQLTLTQRDDNAAQGLTSGAHSFVWEARNQ